MKKTPLVKCPECAGIGEVPLKPELLETLLALPRAGMHAAEVAAVLKSNNTTNAMNNRLEDLRALGLVKRTRRAKFWIYKRTPQIKQ